MNLTGVPAELRQKVKRLRTMERERPDNIKEAGPDQESVWDYPRPPRVESEDRRLRLRFNGITIADSTSAFRVLETSSPPAYYMPPGDVHTKYLEPSERSALCEWKGFSEYWSVRVDERFAENAAWSYPEPWVRYETIQNHIAFNAGLMDACYVGSHRVEPQPGKYYGGWITPEVVGPFKGVPGSKQW